MSEKRGTRGFFVAILAGLVLTVVLAFIGLRIEVRLASLKTDVQELQPRDPLLPRLESALKRVAEGQTVYVPAYSHIQETEDRVLPFKTTLTVRNTDPLQPIVINSVRYYDAAGEMLHQYQGEPVVLDPMAVADYLIEQRDTAGGAGASFVVDWVAEKEANEPVIEAVMISTSASWAISFVRSGHPVANVPPGE